MFIIGTRMLIDRRYAVKPGTARGVKYDSAYSGQHSILVVQMIHMPLTSERDARLNTVSDSCPIVYWGAD